MYCKVCIICFLAFGMCQFPYRVPIELFSMSPDGYLLNYSVVLVLIELFSCTGTH